MSLAQFKHTRKGVKIGAILSAPATVRGMVAKSEHDRPAVEAVGARIAEEVGDLADEERKYVGRWKNIMDSTIWQMKNGGSDINIYGATNQDEFFDVVSEYFFEQPDLLKANHPELHEMLARIYKTER